MRYKQHLPIRNVKSTTFVSALNQCAPVQQYSTVQYSIVQYSITDTSGSAGKKGNKGNKRPQAGNIGAAATHIWDMSLII
jgi:hypothetical protein